MKSKSSKPALFALSFALLLSTQLYASDDLVNACKAGDLNKVKELVGNGADVNYQDATGGTPISVAFFWPEITKYLLDNGADPNGGTYPALVQAANNYSVDVMKLLLAAGADASKPGRADPGAGLRKMIADEQAKGKKANKAMINAWEAALKNLQPMDFYPIQQTVQQTNCVPCLKLLLDNGAKTDVVADGNLLHTLAAFGMTPQGRKEAFAAGKPAVEAYGLKVPDWYADLPEELNGTSKQMAELLIGSGLDVDAKNSAGLTPLLTALGVHKAGVAQALVDGGADVNYVPDTNNAKDALAHAAEIGDVDLLASILAKGPDVNRETWDLDKETGTYAKGFTALTRAAIYNNLECAKMLIDAGCKIKEGVSGYFSKEARSTINGNPIRDITGRQLYCRYKLKNKMAIYFAIENNNLEMVKLLATSFGWYQNHSMEMNAQVGNLDNTSALKGACVAAGGKFTPSRYARTLGMKEIQKYLESEGK